MIRKATEEDASRIAEILVFVKRMKYRPIFKDDAYAFVEMQVLPIAKKYVEDGIIVSVKFTGGCNGNTQGISALIKGMKVTDAIKKLKGIDCNGRGTSCPDQLAIALENILRQHSK